MTFHQWYERISLMKLDEDFNEIFTNIDPANKRMQCIKTLLKTELNYLIKIRELLTVLKNLFDKGGYKQLNYKNQLLFYKRFSVIFNIHHALHTELINELMSSQGIGKIILNYLVKPELTDAYVKYIDNCSKFMKFCQQIKQLEIKIQSSNTIESIIMMPIQRFPQLQTIFIDLYKNMTDIDKDKVNIFKVTLLVKSISMILDQRQKLIESTEINEISDYMKQFKICIKSKKIISKSSVYYFKPNFNIPRKVIKLPYTLLLCDSEIIIYPKTCLSNEISPEMVFYYPLSDINVEIKHVFRFKTATNSLYEFQKTKELFPLIVDSSLNDEVIREIEEILSDYNLIIKICDDVKQLNFRYQSIDQVKISRTLLKLQMKLNEKERELNNYFAFMIDLTIIDSGSSKDSKIFQFDSSRLANEWKIAFYRNKFSMGLNESINWLSINSTKQNHTYETFKEQTFPLYFPPYYLRKNGIINLKFIIAKCQIITIIFGTKISRCLWLSMNDGYVIILHYNYKEWTIVESFQTKIDGPINAICSFSSFDSKMADIEIDTELWMGYENQIVIHSLLNNQRSKENKRFILTSDINTICQVLNKMYIGLRSLEIIIYSQTTRAQWIIESTIYLKKCIFSSEEEIRKIEFDNDCMIYVVCTKQIILYDVAHDKNIPIKIFKTDNNITAFHYCSDGIWISTCGDLNLSLYDKIFNSTLQSLNIPVSFFGKHATDSIISIVFTDKYLWIGTEDGYILIISTVDRLSCIDTKVTTYLNCAYFNGPINILIPFQNIHGVHLKSKYQTDINKRTICDISTSQNKRSNSTPPSVERIKNELNYDSDEDCNSKGKGDQVDYANNLPLKNAYENLKNSTPLLILAFANGIYQISDFDKCEFSYDLQEKEPILLTFFE